MNLVKEPQISVEWIGSEREPVITIDDFAQDPDALRNAAKQSEFRVIGDYYPGLRAKVPQSYFADIGNTLGNVLREFFQCRAGADVLSSYYSLVTTPPAELTLAQRIPHADAYNDQQIAILHYLCRDDLGGTAFFRQRATGFETISEDRVETFHHALAADLVQHGEPEPHYIGSDSPLFERTHLCAPKYNRALIYRGKMLHCGALDTTPDLPTDIENGRLTIASFLNSRSEASGGRR
ncbi:MAG: DUF6445 family protein [Sphingorhabdus sp.]